MAASKDSAELDEGGTKLEFLCARCSDTGIFEIRMGYEVYYMDPCPYCAGEGWVPQWPSP